MRGRFLEAILQRTERKLAGPGRPGTADAWWLVERWEALRLALGARGSLAARGGYVNPASKGCLTQHPWRLPPLHPLARVREGLANLGRIAPRDYKTMSVIPGRLRPCASESGIQTLGSAVQHLWIPGSRRRGAPRNDEWVAV
jgi:hypothetical protein